MIIFHEGMPRSGKSFSAIKDHLIPALAKGRRCYVRIDGLNFPKIAELAGITEERCRELLIELTEQQCAAIEDQALDKDAFLFIDEAQNYWPAKRTPAEPKLMQFVAEHGHHGYDILLMGQLAKDVHSVWINRTNRKIQFIKKDVVGKPNQFLWKMYNGTPNGRGVVQFTEVQRGTSEYDEKYFGTYKSHSDGTENKENYADDRANIFKSAIFRRWLPLYGVVFIVALGVVIWAFKGGIVGDAAKEPAKAQPAPAQPAPPPPQPRREPPPQQEQKIVPEPPNKNSTPVFKISEHEVQPVQQADFIDDLCKKYRIRLGGVIRGVRQTTAVIEWRNEQDGLAEQLRLHDVSGFGWMVMISADGRIATMQKGDRRYVVTSWPLQDERGRATEVQQQAVRNAGGAPDRSAARTDAPPARIEPHNDSTNPRYNVALRGQ